ncbi:prepilin peptidase [Lapillicoccus sp.]|uniref:prepilin peptidase n=1 Tax=Lapillicoccus sp. TaxID=1909287 RepID=UPI0025D1F101|nr:prepilin peptidase [Lapillicoccus sp.]
MTRIAPLSAPPWVVVLVVVAGLAVGLVLARRLATTGYRLDDEDLRPVGDLPHPRGAKRRPVLGPLPHEPRPLPGAPWVITAVVPVLWGLLAWQLGGLARGAMLPAYLLLSGVGVALVWIDADVHRLPEGLTLPALPAIALLLAAASLTTGDWGALGRAAICGVAGYLFYLALALLVPGGLGLGDATLGALVSLPLGYLGWSEAVMGIVLTYLFGGAFSLVAIALRRVRLKGYIAFGPFIVIGSLAAVFIGYPTPGP